MKILPIKFPNSTDLASFAMGDTVTVTKGDIVVAGNVLTTSFQAPDPPPPPVIDGLYNIEKHVP